MKSIVLYGLTVILMAAFVFASCKKDDTQSTAGQLDKVNIGDAKYIVRENSVKFKKSIIQMSENTESEFFKITESGIVEPILFTKEDGSNVDFYVYNFQVINKDYVYINGSYDGITSFLVNKKSEKIYGIPLLGGSDEYHFIVNDDDIWVYPTYQGYCKISTNDFTIQEYEAEDGYKKILNKDGIAFYNSSVGYKLRHPGGKIYLMKDIIENFWYNDTEEITNRTQDRFVLNTDGNYYDFHIDGEFVYQDGFPSSRIDYITVYRISTNGNTIEKNELSLNTVKWNNFNNFFGNIKGIALNHISNSVLFFVNYDLYDNETNTNNCYEYNASTNKWKSYQIDIEGLSFNYYQTSSFLYFISTDRQKIYRLDLVNGYQTKCIDMSGYEIYDIATSIQSDDLSFTALRYEDGKNITGVLNKAGDVESIVEKDSNTKLDKLIQLN